MSTVPELKKNTRNNTDVTEPSQTTVPQICLSVTAIMNGIRCTISWGSSSGSRHSLFRKAMMGPPAANSGALQHLIVQRNASWTSIGLLEDREEEEEA